MRLYFIYLFIHLLFLFRTLFCCMTGTRENYIKYCRLIIQVLSRNTQNLLRRTKCHRKKNSKSSEFLTYVCDSVKNSTVLICFIDSIPIKRSQFTELG